MKEFIIGDGEWCKYPHELMKGKTQTQQMVMLYLLSHRHNKTEAQNVSILDDINSFRALDIAIRDDSTWDYVELNMTIIPEPSTVAFLGLSTMGLYGYRRRERILGNFGAIDILNYKPESKRSLRWRYKSR